jgi:aminomethyltransferase
MRGVDLDGHDSREFLRTLIANDVAKLTFGRALYSCMLRADGCVIDDLIVYWMGGEHYRVVVNAGTADKDLAWMHEVQRGSTGPGKHFRVSLLPRRELAMIAVQGPRARAILRNTIEGLDGDAALAMDALKPFSAAMVDEFFIGRTGYTGEDGCEVVLPAAEVADLWQRLAHDGVTPCGLGARDTLRLEARMPLYGNELGDEISPLEAGLGWAVALDKGPFVGREPIAAMKESSPPRRTVGFRLLDRAGSARHGYEVQVDGRTVGEVTSGAMSPTLGENIGLALVERGAAGVGKPLDIIVRGKPVRAEQVKVPFYKRDR